MFSSCSRASMERLRSEMRPGSVGVLGQEGLACGLGLLQPGDLGGDLAAPGLQELGFGLADGSPCLHGGVEAGAYVLQARARALCLAHRPRLSSSATCCACW